MSKYDKLFTPEMSTKQITNLYFRLVDEVMNDENAQKELYEAHLKAWRKATKKEKEEYAKALKDGFILCD